MDDSAVLGRVRSEG